MVIYNKYTITYKENMQSTLVDLDIVIMSLVCEKVNLGNFS